MGTCKTPLHLILRFNYIEQIQVLRESIKPVPYFPTTKAFQILPLTLKFLLLHSITTLKLSAFPFLLPEKLCGRRWALRESLTGTQLYPKHAPYPWVADLCQTHAQSRHNRRKSPTDAELSLAGCSLGRVPNPSQPTEFSSAEAH